MPPQTVCEGIFRYKKRLSHNKYYAQVSYFKVSQISEKRFKRDC